MSSYSSFGLTGRTSEQTKSNDLYISRHSIFSHTFAQCSTVSTFIFRLCSSVVESEQAHSDRSRSVPFYLLWVCHVAAGILAGSFRSHSTARCLVWACIIAWSASVYNPVSAGHTNLSDLPPGQPTLELQFQHIHDLN